MKLRRTAVIASVAAAGVGVSILAGTGAFADSPAPAPSAAKPTIVLVHGAFADASSWNGVAKNLQHLGYPVVAPANPLRGLDSDSAYIASVLQNIKGPVVLVGHSYGGEVITNAAAADKDVKALVYVAAIAPDEGQSANAILGAYQGSKLPEALNPQPYTLPDGSTSSELYVKPDKFREAFAGDVSASTAAVMAATQRPVDASSLDAPSKAAAWKNIPSWYLVAKNDNTIPPAAQRDMAKHIGARTTEVSSSHAAAVSHPAEVTNIILNAARSTAH